MSKKYVISRLADGRISHRVYITKKHSLRVSGPGDLSDVLELLRAIVTTDLYSLVKRLDEDSLNNPLWRFSNIQPIKMNRIQSEIIRVKMLFAFIEMVCNRKAIIQKLPAPVQY